MQSIYDMLYDYLINNIFASSSLDSYANSIGVTTSLNSWLAHTTTITLMVLFVVCLIGGAIWLFKVVSGLILLKH